MRSFVMLDAVGNELSVCEKTASIIETYLEKGDTLIKVVNCAKYYSVALFKSGNLVLLAPKSQKKHGIIIETNGGFVQDVDAGDSHIVFCKNDGSVFSFGYSNKHGQLGDGTVWLTFSSEEEEDSEDEEELPKLSPPKKISGFGPNNNNNEIEIIDGKRQYIPIISVACGANHTLLLTKYENCIYGCGLGLQGQLGGKRRPLLQPSFKSIRILFGLPLKQIVAAGNHSFVLLKTGKLLAFGDNTCGQLGLGSTKGIGTPTAIKFNSKIENDKNENKKILDTYNIKGLRAAWGTAESMYYPLRVERLNPELDLNEPFIISIWSCKTRSVVLTNKMEWLSCGLPLSRSSCNFKNQFQRMDRYGPLGYWIENKKESTFFRKMQWSDKIFNILNKNFNLNLENNDNIIKEILNKIHLVCTNRSIILILPKFKEEENTFLFIQGEISNNLLKIDQGIQSQLSSVFKADKILQDNEKDDDSFEFLLSKEEGSIIKTEEFLFIM